MQHCLRRIVLAQGPQRIAIPCTRSSPPQLLLRNGRRLFPVRGYADDAKESDANVQGVESTGTVPEDPDLITTEAPETEEPPPIPAPSAKSSPPSPYFPKPRGLKPFSFKLEETNNPARAALQLRKALTQTTLRKRLGWSEPLRGINPAYDMAIDYIRNDRKEKIQIIKRLDDVIRRERESSSSCLHSLGRRLTGDRWCDCRTSSGPRDGTISTINPPRYQHPRSPLALPKRRH
jgi:hypothetical protein